MAIEKKVHRGGAFADFIAEGVQQGNVLYISGQVGIGADGKTPDSMAEQTVALYQNAQNVLAEFGATLDNVVEETVFVTDMGEFMGSAGEIYKSREQAYGQKPDVTQTVVQVVALVQPALKLEIKFIAHL